MSTLTRILFLGLTMVGLAACSGGPPNGSVLDEASRSNIFISDVSVDVKNLGANTSGRPVPSTTVKSFVERAATGQLKGQGTGNRRVRAALSIDSVNIITATQSVLIGGESIMSGTVALVDARSGETLLAPTALSAGGGGWVAGGLVAVASRDDAATELRQMSNEFAARALTLTVGDPLIASANTASRKPVPKAQDPNASEGNLSDAELEFAVKQARSAAAAEVRGNYGVGCVLLKCERELKRAQDEAEARVRREAAATSN